MKNKEIILTKELKCGCEAVVSLWISEHVGEADRLKYEEEAKTKLNNSASQHQCLSKVEIK